MFTKIKRIVFLLSVILLGVAGMPMEVSAKSYAEMSMTFDSEDYDDNKIEKYHYENSDSGYECNIYDEALLFQTGSNDYSNLKKELIKLSEYGHIVVRTVDDAKGRMTRDIARNEIDNILSHEDSAAIFLIDMDNRMIYIQSKGRINQVIDASMAETITDNVYKYATNGNYERCALEAILQMNTLLDGGKVAQPMKYICNALLAMLFGIFIMYYIAKQNSSSADIVSVGKLLKNTNYYNKIDDADVLFQTSHRTRISSSSSGGSHHSGSSGGHSSHSSGGGHRF